MTEKNLFDALSFTEAEARTIEELTPYISGDFSVKAVKKTKISEIFFDDTADKFYLVNVAFITIYVGSSPYLASFSIARKFCGIYSHVQCFGHALDDPICHPSPLTRFRETERSRK